MSMFSAEETALLGAVLARLLPPDADAGAALSAADAEAYVVAQLDRTPGAASAIGRGLRDLDREARARFELGFHALSAAEQDQVLRPFDRTPWLRRLCDLCAEGIYADAGNGGNRGNASWPILGYVEGVPDLPTGSAGRAGQSPRPLADGLTDFDVVIVGSGAGGGVAACVLAEGGKSVLLIERGAERTHADSGYRDHLRNHWLATYGDSTGLSGDDHPRVAVDIDGRTHTVMPHEPLYQHIAAAVGGGTLVYGMQAWRYHPDDFRMATLYGVPEGSSLVDWPIDYDELAPFYEQAEWEVGVAGEAGGNRNEGRRAKSYPMPPVPRYGAADVLRRGAERLGIGTFVPPLLLNTVPRDGRGACIECGACIGFPCPTDAKNGTQNTMIRRALATGRCTLVTGAMVHRVTTDEGGRVTGVAFTEASGRARTVRAGAVVVAGGAIESARLLLNSANAREPEGLGNGSGLVGRNLQGHVYPTVLGLFEEEVHSSHGPGVTIATTDWNHGNPGVIGGAMLADDFCMTPMAFWHTALPPDLQRWGRPAHDFMRDNFHHVLKLKGPVHEIPNPEARMALDPAVRDRWGLPVARLSGTIHPETLRTAHYMFDRGRDWLEAAGARRTWGERPRMRLSAGQHQAGTCRMGSDPAASVTDSFGRVWGHDNLFVCDGAVHPTNGGYNPVLTIMALSFRAAAHMRTNL